MKKVISILLSLAMVLSLVGCSGSSPKDTVSSYLDSFKSGKVEESRQYIKETTDTQAENASTKVLDNEDPEVDAAMKKAYSKLTYKILDSTVDGDKATVETEITAPNLGVIMTELIQESMPLAFASAFSENAEDDNMDELMNTMLIDKLNSKDLSMISKTVNINLVKENDTWLIEFDDDLVDGLTGNMSAIANIFGE